MSLISNRTLDINHENVPCYYTVPEVAKLLKVSKSYIYDLINQKKIDFIQLSERRTRISSIALDEFTQQKMDNHYGKNYNRGVVQPPKRGRKLNGSVKK
jgi:excisionase family DNA binding protein